MGARDRARGDAAVRALQSEGLDVRLLQIDVADEDSVQRAAKIVAAETGGVLHVLVNNAGIILDRTRPPGEARMEDIMATLEVNLYDPIRVTAGPGRGDRGDHHAK